MSGRGKRPRPPVEKEEEFKVELDKLYENKNGDRIKVDYIQAMLVDKFDCNYSASGVCTLLDRINIVWITGRS